MKFDVVVWQEGSLFVSSCPSLGIASQGESIERAAENLEEAMELYFAGMPSEEKQSILSNVPSQLSTRTVSPAITL